MGLDCSHDAFHGAYSAFMRFRTAVAEAAGGGYKEGKSSFPDGYFEWDDFDNKKHPGLMAFFSHSDCDGEIPPDTCRLIADDLEALLPKLDAMGMGAGHIEARGGYGGVTRKFIAGCRAAAEADEPLGFW
jgi:hypothetical protein